MSNDLTQRANAVLQMIEDEGTNDWGAVPLIRDLLARLQQAEQARDAACHKWETFVRELHLARAKQETAEAENARLRAAITTLLRELDVLMSESHGVCGLHLNGDEAPWDEILDGGRFERVFLEPVRDVVREAGDGGPTR